MPFVLKSEVASRVVPTFDTRRSTGLADKIKPHPEQVAPSTRMSLFSFARPISRYQAVDQLRFRCSRSWILVVTPPHLWRQAHED